MVSALLVAVFVGYNIGGSSTGVAFGPAVGSRITGKTLAAVLFTGFALLGGWTVGRNVITTTGSGIVAEEFTLAAILVSLIGATIVTVPRTSASLRASRLA
jgi:PiT family inorganic phosphate transporter